MFLHIHFIYVFHLIDVFIKHTCITIILFSIHSLYNDRITFNSLWINQVQYPSTSSTVYLVSDISDVRSSYGYRRKSRDTFCSSQYLCYLIYLVIVCLLIVNARLRYRRLCLLDQ